ncbi:MAG TPA: hypothetical protein VIG30_16005, partial [Ktedonobacterales bacterium]
MPRTRPAAADATLVARVQATLTELVGIASVSGQEQGVRDFLRARLARGGIASTVDAAGNLLARIPGA